MWLDADRRINADVPADRRTGVINKGKRCGYVSTIGRELVEIVVSWYIQSDQQARE